VNKLSFNPNDLHRLNRLVFAIQRAALTESTGGHRTRHRGQGVEFLDFRPYVPGDDLRKLDWNLLARTRQPFIRLHEEPRQLAVTLLLDASRSMFFGSPTTKFQQSQLIAAALGSVALRGGDRLFVCSFSDSLSRPVGPLVGMRSLPRLLRALDEIPDSGRLSNLQQAATDLRKLRRHRGLVVILSDFLNVSGREHAIESLVGGRARILVIQVLDAIDRGAGLVGMLRLRDSESGRMVDVKVTPSVLARYQEAFTAGQDALESHVHQLGQFYAATTTAQPYLELVCQVLRTKAILK